MTDYNKTLFLQLRELNNTLLGDSIVPKGASLEVKSDSIKYVRAIQRLKVQERSQLRIVERAYKRIEGEHKREAQYLVEIHKKFSTSVACIIFVLIGAPLGIMARKGGIGTGIIYSLAFFVIYWASLMGGENFADRLMVSPILAMWFSNIIIGIFGIIITIHMTLDRYSGNSGLFYRVRRFIQWITRLNKKIG